MKISRFVHVINDNEIWHSLNKTKIKLHDKQLIDYIKNNKNKSALNDIPQKLVDLKIILDNEDEAKIIQDMILKTTDSQFQSLYLMTTTSCNLDCSYCFYRCSSSKSLKKKKQMSFGTAKKAIDKFYDIVKRNQKYEGYWQQITFYGGEPLLNKQMLELAIPYAKQKFADEFTSIVINTNLTILDDFLIKLFKDNSVEVQVSIDGNKKQHDLHRKTIDGMGTYDAVIYNAKKLISSGINVLPMITATDSNVENLSTVISDIVNKLNTKNFAVNILITNSFSVNEKYATFLAREMLATYINLKSKSVDLEFVSLYTKLMGTDKTIAKNSCGATRKITVFPDENVYACQALEKVDINSMGRLGDNFLKNANWLIWEKRNRFQNETCLDCEAVASCGGGCAAGSHHSNGSIYDIDYNQCQYIKKLFHTLVK